MHQVDKEILGFDRAVAIGPDEVQLGLEREHRGRPVGRRIGVDEAAAERSPVAHLDVADVRSQLGQQRTSISKQRRGFDVVVRRHGADGDVPVCFADVIEIGDPPEVDDRLGLGQPQFHRRNQAVAAGEQLRVVTVLREKLDRLVDRRWTEIFELSGIHFDSPL